MEMHVVAEMKGESPGVGLVPAFGERGGEVKIAVAGDEAVEEDFVDVL